MARIFVLFLTGFFLITGCGGGGGTTTVGGGGSSDGGASSGGGGSGDGGGDGSDGAGGDPPFVTAFRVLDVPDPDGVYATLENDRNAVFAAALGSGGTSYSVSPFSGIPAQANAPPSGTLDYTGYLMVLLGSNDFSVGANVTGEANLSVALSDHSISGQATNFLGKPNDENGDPQVVSYLGTVTISSGTLSSGPNDEAFVTLDIDGTIDDAVNTFVINNTLTGALYGPNGEGLSARQNGDAMDSTINGGAASYDQATLRAVRQP